MKHAATAFAAWRRSAKWRDRLGPAIAGASRSGHSMATREFHRRRSGFPVVTRRRPCRSAVAAEQLEQPFVFVTLDEAAQTGGQVGVHGLDLSHQGQERFAVAARHGRAQPIPDVGR